MCLPSEEKVSPERSLVSQLNAQIWGTGFLGLTVLLIEGILRCDKRI